MREGGKGGVRGREVGRGREGRSEGGRWGGRRGREGKSEGEGGREGKGGVRGREVGKGREE